jgi:hypothetical protein
MDSKYMAKNIRADESILSSATSNGSSLRTTIPSWIVAKWELKKGDIFRWALSEKDGLIYIHPYRKPNDEKKE